MNHKSHNTNHVRRNNQAGVTLILAIMIMAGLTLIATTVSFLTIRQIRNSRGAFLTNPAISAAEAGGEQGIWNLKRNIGSISCGGSQSSAVSSDNLGTTNTLRKWQIVYSGANLDVLPGSSSPTVLYLYDPSDINGDPGLTNCAYNTLTVTSSDKNAWNLDVLVERLDGTFVGHTLVNPGGTGTINNLTVAPGADKRMKVTITSSGPVGTSEAFVTTDLGLPNYPVVDSLGCSTIGTIHDPDPTKIDCTDSKEIFTRRLNITIPQ